MKAWAGFTLLELALAVAVIAVLSGLTAVNVVRYQRVLAQRELDGIAREIFIAAQNHLTMAESQGFMGVSDYGIVYPKESDNAPDMYYYVVNQRVDNVPPNMLDVMLPFASVDETVRGEGGSYVIRYQKDPALVLDVFYAHTTGRFPHTFTPDEVSPQWIRDDYRGSDNQEARGHYPQGRGADMIGWYGVQTQQTPVSPGKRLLPPTIKVVNAERLYVEVRNPNVDDKARLHLEITGVKSGKKCPPIELIHSGFPVHDTNYIEHLGAFDDTSTFRVILDDVTQKGTHFHDLTGGAGLYPGEDIIICAVAYNNQELTNIASSASSTTNSLFASVSADGSAANIANFRHLENLDSAVSHIGNIRITHANQTNNMDWDGFMSVITGKAVGAAGSRDVSVYDADGTPTKTGCYFPVTNGGKVKADGTIAYDAQITYNGGGYTISNVTIQADESAGLFAKLGNRSSVTNLKLSNFKVTSRSGAAGTLAGVLDSSNVGVLNGADVPGVLAYGVGGAVTGRTSAGGLVGELAGSCTVKQSAAAVYVTSKSVRGNAGGLIGTVSPDASATVEDSYAGGHIYQGDYDSIEAYSHNNVTASANAGGLIGSSLGSLTVKNCYATTSVGGATVGGLIGYATGGTVTNCYATGYFTGNDDSKGALVGELEDGAGFTFTGNGYFTALESEAVRPVGYPPGTWNDNEIAELDNKPEAYGAMSGELNAVPYDTDTLGGKYYPLKTISELHSGLTAPDWMLKHYGDWPMWYDVPVPNEVGTA